jgi:two-component system phosphate regulon response regulator PhoB
VDPLTGGVTAREQLVQLRRQEFRLLHFLMQRAERVFSRAQLLARIWGEHSVADVRAVDVTVQRTRKALMPHGCAEYLQTVRGVGYRLSARGGN